MLNIPSSLIRAVNYGIAISIVDYYESRQGMEHRADDRSDLQRRCERQGGSIHLPKSRNSYELWKAMGMHSMLGT
jgi:hypothetical protein